MIKTRHIYMWVYFGFSTAKYNTGYIESILKDGKYLFTYIHNMLL